MTSNAFYTYTRKFKNVRRIAYAELQAMLKSYDDIRNLFFMDQMGNMPTSVANAATWIKHKPSTQLVFVMEEDGDAITRFAH